MHIWSIKQPKHNLCCWKMS